MTLDASFEPIFVTTAYHPTLRRISCGFRLVSIKEDKKKHTCGPNNARRVVWACFHHHRMLSLSPLRILQIKSYIDNKILVSIKKDEEIFLKKYLQVQTTRLALFGPVFITTAYKPTLCHISCIFRLVSIKGDKEN